MQAAERIVKEASDAARQTELKVRAQQQLALSARPLPHLTPGGMTPVATGGGVNQGPPDFQSTSPNITSIANFTAPERALLAIEREAKRSTALLVTKCRQHTAAAVDVLVDVMNRSTHAPSRVAAAKAVIEFGNGKAPERIQIEKVFTPEQMKAMAEAIVLRRAKEIDGGQLGVLSERS